MHNESNSRVPRCSFMEGYTTGRINLEALSKMTAEEWERKGEESVLDLFRASAARVPAYRALLERSGVDPATITSASDLRRVPTVDKNSYLRANTTAELCWDGRFHDRAWTIYTTSGSTGEPFYFAHTRQQDDQYALLAEQYLRTNFDLEHKSTLYVNAFPLGAWIGGLFTFKAITTVAERGDYALSIINPGLHKAEVIKAIKKLGSSFDQVVIGSYAPFLKDILDDGVREGMDWTRYNLGFIFSAEGFSEGFRDYVLGIAGKTDPYHSSLNHYGTVDLGTMAYETPLAILVRRIAMENKAVYDTLFKESLKVPTLCQYMPPLFYFEEVDGTLLCSAWSGMPLVRYDLKDSGGVYTFPQIEEKLRACGIDLRERAREANVSVTEMPFVYVYERNDFSISFYAFLVHPATFRRAFETPEMRSLVTGKFTMMVKYDKKHNPFIEINAELRSGVEGTREQKRLIEKAVTAQLTTESSEFREVWRHKGRSVRPRVVCWQYESEKFFRPGTKQKWVIHEPKTV